VLPKPIAIACGGAAMVACSIALDACEVGAGGVRVYDTEIYAIAPAAYLVVDFPSFSAQRIGN
jgi:hypothetical protein